MAKTFRKPGVILTFDNEMWFVQMKDMSEADRLIDDIKEYLIGAEGKWRAQAQQLSADDLLQLSEVEVSDMERLLSRGITIRPMGR